MQQQNRKTPLVFRVSLVLLCVLVISTRLMGGLYARYSTSATGSDSARVAKFSFTDNYDTQTRNVSAAIAPGSPLPITVENNGEVAIQYKISVINLTGNLPIVTSVAAPSETIYPGETKTIDIVFWDTNETNPEYINPEYMGKMDLLQITVSVEQVD